MRAGSATSGSTSMCGRTGRPAERCTGTCGTAARSATRAPGGRRAAGRVDIRPGIVEEKSRVGDWEGDTVVGARHRGAVLSLVDRAFTLLALRRTAGETGEAMRKRLGPYKEFVHTTDNGKEFAAHREVAGARVVLLRAAVPGARPERAHERAGSLPEGDRQAEPRRTQARGEPAQQPAAQGAGLPDSRGSFQAGVDRGPAPLKRNPARAVGVRAHGRRLPNNCAGAAASRAGSWVAGHGQTTCRPGETGRRPGGIFRRGGGVRLRSGYALPAANAPAAPAS